MVRNTSTPDTTKVRKLDPRSARADPTGAPGTHVPIFRIQFLSFSCSFELRPSSFELPTDKLSQRLMIRCVSVVDDYLNTVQRNLGIRELSEEMIEQGLKVQLFGAGDYYLAEPSKL